MSAKITASADGTEVTIGNASENAIEINSTDKTVSIVSPYKLVESTPMFRGTTASFTSTVAPSQAVNLTSTHNTDITKSGDTLTPTKAGWYVCNLTGLCTGTTNGLGLGLVSTTGGTQFQAQPPYSTNNAYVTVTSLIYFNGTTDNIKFEVFGSVTGCAFTNLVGTMILLRTA